MPSLAARPRFTTSTAGFVARGVALGAVLAIGFAAIALSVTHGGDLVGRVDRAAAAAFRALPSAVGDASLRAARLGDPLPAMAAALLVAAGLALRRRWLFLAAWVVALAGNGVWTWALKRLLARARPVDADGLAMSATYSFPSAHSSGLLVACGLLTYLAWRSLPRRMRVPTAVAAGLFVAAVGVGRVLAGHHHATDVLAGFLSGGVWLTACIVVVELLRRRAAALLASAPPARPEALAGA